MKMGILRISANDNILLNRLRDKFLKDFDPGEIKTNLEITILNLENSIEIQMTGKEKDLKRESRRLKAIKNRIKMALIKAAGVKIEWLEK